MKKEQFEILMYALYKNKQLVIPQGVAIQEWIDNAFLENQELNSNDTTAYYYPDGKIIGSL